MPDVGSSVPRRQLGRLLRQARERAGLSLEGAARAMEWSRAKMYRVEAGESPMRRHEVLALSSLYDVPPDLIEVLTALASETKNKGWWHSYGEVVPAWFELYVGLEAAASGIRTYEPSLVPGLLQTAEYAAAVIRAKPGITDAEVTRTVELRIERQRLLARRLPAAPTLDAIIDEAVLRRPIADRDAMRRQLSHLCAMNGPRARMRVLPLGVGPHRASMAGAFAILDFPAAGTRQPEPTTVYSESLTGALYLDKPAEIEAYEDAWKALDAVALPEEASQHLVATIMKGSADA